MIKDSFVLSRENIDVSQSFFQYLVNYIEENVDLHVYGQENISYNSMTPHPSPSSDLAFTRGHFTVLKIQIDDIEFDE